MSRIRTSKTLIRTRSVHTFGQPRVDLGVWVILSEWAARGLSELGSPTRTDCDASESDSLRVSEFVEFG